MNTEINFSRLEGNDGQNLEALHFLRANASRKIDRLKRAGSIAKLQRAIDCHDAICYEITKYAN